MSHDSPPPDATTGDPPGRLRRLFDAALEQPAHARMDWVSSNVADSDERTALLRLLAAGDALGPLDKSLAERVERIGFDDEEVGAADLIGQRIGPFRLLRLLGQGGMATVFLGEREGADFNQQVAVKLLRRGLYSEVEQRLFRRERRALAMLSHPNIARLIDGGVTEAGVPYLVMDYIDGVPITQYAVDNRLDVGARLRLFLVVCRAVTAAHRQLIVHRDLKPSNILVGAGGEVKLLDFGIAKLLDEDDDATRSRLAALTPDYAAPEQLAGGVISTATDVYALGVLLHELLLGVRPGRGPTQRPSSRVTDLDPRALPSPRPALQAALRGDLDNVLMKALAGEAERRYASAGAFAEDIERHLDGRPVVAHPPSRWYRTRKFAQRHRGGVVLTTLFAIGLVLSLVATLWQARVARREAAQARATQEFVIGLFEPMRAGLAEGQAPTLPQLLVAGVKRLDRDFAGDTASRAELTAMFSRVNAQIGELGTAKTLSIRSYDLARQAYGERDARTLIALGQRGRLAQLTGDPDSAMRDLEAAVAGMDAIGLRSIDYAHTLQDLARVRVREARFDEAIALSLKAYEIARTQARPDDPALGSVMNNVGYAYNSADDIERGLQWQQRAYDWHVRVGGGSSRPALSALGNVANGKFRLGRWREAQADLERLLLQSASVSGGPHNLWNEWVQSCSVATALDDLAGAERHCAAALAAAAMPDGDPRSYAITLVFRAALRVQQGRYREARADLAESSRRLRALKGDQSRYLQMGAAIEADMVRIEGTSAQIATALDAVVSAGDFEKNTRNAPVLLAQFALACRHHPLPRCNDEPARRAEALLAKSPYRQHPYRLPARAALTLVDLDAGNAKTRQAALQTTLAAVQPELGADHPWVAEAQAALAQAATAADDDRTATQAIAEARRIAGRLPADHPLRTRLLQAQ
jgi:tetratricopeptide (TPR) repeat protein